MYILINALQCKIDDNMRTTQKQRRFISHNEFDPMVMNE